MKPGMKFTLGSESKGSILFVHRYMQTWYRGGERLLELDIF